MKGPDELLKSEENDAGACLPTNGLGTKEIPLTPGLRADASARRATPLTLEEGNLRAASGIEDENDDEDDSN